METINKAAVQYLDVRGTKDEVSQRLKNLNSNLSAGKPEECEILDGPILSLASPGKRAEKLGQLYNLDGNEFEFASFAYGFSPADSFLLLKNLTPLLAECGVGVEITESGGTITIPGFDVIKFNESARITGPERVISPFEIIRYLSCFFDQDFAAVLQKDGKFEYVCDVSVFEKTPKDASGKNRMMGRDLMEFHANAPSFGGELSSVFPNIMKAFSEGSMDVLVVDLNGSNDYELADGRQVRRFERDKFVPVHDETGYLKGFMGFADVFMQETRETRSPYEGGETEKSLRTQVDLIMHDYLREISAVTHPSVYMCGGENDKKTEMLRQIFRDIERHHDVVMKLAEKLNAERFGEKLELYGISYIGDKCVNDCSYCGHNGKIERERSQLSPDEMRKDFEEVMKHRPEEFCILSGEDPHGLANYVQALQILGELNEKYGKPLKRITFNVAPMGVEDFRAIVEANKTGVPLQYRVFQETYDPEVYSKCHTRGPKSNFAYRYFAQARALQAGFDSVGIGVLLGINNKGLMSNNQEIFDLIMHAEFLKRMFGVYPETVSLPRLQPVEGMEQGVNCPVDDKTFKFYLGLLRLFLPETKIVLTSRESQEMMQELEPVVNVRDLAPRPGVGGNFRASNFQNELGDARSAEEVIEDLVARGRR
ncbi:hypothetical protein KKC94_03100 [Patescibacteria group bacterium]|nr:hypothetical protein [Patescibacteria group bacterium]